MKMFALSVTHALATDPRLDARDNPISHRQSVDGFLGLLRCELVSLK